MLNIILTNARILNVILMDDTMLNVILKNATMLKVMAPKKSIKRSFTKTFKLCPAVKKCESVT